MTERLPPAPPDARGIRDRVRQESRNQWAFLSLFMGVCAWVPLVILMAAPLSLGFAAIAFATSKRQGSTRGLGGAVYGVVLTCIAIVLHLSFALFASAIGWTGHLLGL
jgi:hypothetical protein